jgi:hypothetical protein
MEILMAKILAFDGKQPDASDNILRKVPGRPKNSDVAVVNILPKMRLRH